MKGETSLCILVLQDSSPGPSSLSHSVVSRWKAWRTNTTKPPRRRNRQQQQQPLLQHVACLYCWLGIVSLAPKAQLLPFSTERWSTTPYYQPPNKRLLFLGKKKEIETPRKGALFIDRQREKERERNIQFYDGRLEEDFGARVVERFKLHTRQATGRAHIAHPHRSANILLLLLLVVWRARDDK